jgi:predicted HTH domain antitoxin
MTRLPALELYREDRLSLDRAAELCSTGVERFMQFAIGHGVPPLRYTLEELDADRASFDRLGG